MTSKTLPRYPIYIPSKGRFNPLTANLLLRDGVPFRLVVEPQEADEYRKRFAEENILVLPFSNQGSVSPARNWVKDHATAEGHLRHWQLDDNISNVYRWFNGKRIPSEAGIALAVAEDFVDRYENVAIAGLEYAMFAVSNAEPVRLNTRVYSCSLILNSIPNRWRTRYNEDTDICLQVLADGWCTVLVTAFLIQKTGTMKLKGGNTTTLYGGDGRLKMARCAERLWPGVVSTNRRFKRPQHVVRDSWRKFDTPLIRRKDAEVKTYDIRLEQVTEIKSAEFMQKLRRDGLL